MDEAAGRVPNFVVKSMDKNGKLVPILEATMSKKDGEVQTVLLYNAHLLYLQYIYCM